MNHLVKYESFLNNNLTFEMIDDYLETNTNLYRKKENLTIIYCMPVKNKWTTTSDNILKIKLKPFDDSTLILVEASTVLIDTERRLPFFKKFDLYKIPDEIVGLLDGFYKFIHDSFYMKNRMSISQPEESWNDIYVGRTNVGPPIKVDNDKFFKKLNLKNLKTNHYTIYEWKFEIYEN